MPEPFFDGDLHNRNGEKKMLGDSHGQRMHQSTSVAMGVVVVEDQAEGVALFCERLRHKMEIDVVEPRRACWSNSPVSTNGQALLSVLVVLVVQLAHVRNRLRIEERRD